MTYLLWSILNIAVFSLFFVVCFWATKLIKERFGIILAVFFVFGLLSFAAHESTDEPKQNQTTNPNTWYFTSSDSIAFNTMAHKSVNLKDNMISTYIFGVTYGRHKNNSGVVPITAYSATNGFISGTEWTPSYISVFQSDTEDQLVYYVIGQIKWKLLGTTFVTQSNEFKGTISTK